ncbi:MAG: TlpA family protein disulfide reductase [Candidatus Omnitrophica bacterium]|nr:TlpA family protein disulfide reductase [Candidatus Omnitrophota bacterium]
MAAFVLSSALLSAPVWAAAKASAPARKEAPRTRVTTLAGQPWDLAAQKGKAVIIDFWATWCPPCREEIPHFIALYSKYQPRVEILGIALDEAGRRPVDAFVKENGVNYSIAMGQDGVLANAYGGVRGIPTTFVIDKQGKIYKRYVGYQDQSVFEQDITALLQE